MSRMCGACDERPGTVQVERPNALIEGALGSTGLRVDAVQHGVTFVCQVCFKKEFEAGPAVEAGDCVSADAVRAAQGVRL